MITFNFVSGGYSPPGTTSVAFHFTVGGAQPKGRFFFVL